ncbi:hypothetical protein GCM10020256_06260 [Streptomyces thermocoprophilus]
MTNRKMLTIAVLAAILTWSTVMTVLGQVAAVAALLPSLGLLVQQIVQALTAPDGHPAGGVAAPGGPQPAAGLAATGGGLTGGVCPAPEAHLPVGGAPAPGGRPTAGAGPVAADGQEPPR